MRALLILFLLSCRPTPCEPRPAKCAKLIPYTKMWILAGCMGKCDRP